MEKKIFETSGIEILSERELNETQGGFIFLLIYVVNTTLVVGTVVGVAAAGYAGFQSGYDTVHKALE